MPLKDMYEMCGGKVPLEYRHKTHIILIDGQIVLLLMGFHRDASELHLDSSMDELMAQSSFKYPWTFPSCST